MKSSQCFFVLAAFFGLTDSQVVSEEDDRGHHLRRRLQAEEKRYPSLWAPAPQGKSPQGNGVSTSQEDRLLPALSNHPRQMTENKQQQQQQQHGIDNAPPPSAGQEESFPHTSLWATDTQMNLVKTDSPASSHQGNRKYPSLWSTDSQVDQRSNVNNNVNNNVSVNNNVATPSYTQNNNLRASSANAVQQQSTSDSVRKPAVNNPTHEPNRRKFVSYKSSKWEQYWLDNVEGVHDDRKICKVLLGDQITFVRDYLEILCTSKLMAPHQNWCVIDDGYAPLWFNTANTQTLELTFERPVPLVVGIPPPEIVIPGPQHEHVLSKFTFQDEATGQTYHEYVEPMVGHLRFPLQKCLHPKPMTPQYKNHYMSFRGWILPPPPPVRGDKALLFDALSSSWESKRGGFDLRFITNTWHRHGVEVDNMWVLNAETAKDDFYQDVPEDMIAKTTFQQCNLASRLEEDSNETPFLPLFINKRATVNDYVILKVDIGELAGRFHHLAYLDSWTDNRVDELIWEHKSESMFLSDNNLLDTDLTLRQSYELVLMMRRRGIRAHAWM